VVPKIILLQALSAGTKTNYPRSLSNSLITSGLLRTEGYAVRTLIPTFLIWNFDISLTLLTHYEKVSSSSFSRLAHRLALTQIWK
jgi:hypothetical protein